MKSGPFFIFPSLFLSCSILLAGCASSYDPTGYFENYDRMESGPYFKQEFTETSADFSKYKKIKLMPVTLDYFDKESEYKLNPGEKEWLVSSLEKSLKEALSKSYSLEDLQAPPDAETLVVEPALVYARKPHRLINVVLTLLIMVPPSSGSAALEVKMIDGLSGKTVALVAEKRTGAGDLKSLILDPFMRLGHLDAIFKTWAKNLTAFIASQKYLAPPGP